MGRREVFDPTRSFAANREFAWGGQRVLAGAPFSDKSNLRRLRQLYDARYVKMLPPEEVEDDENDGRPLFTEMTEEEIRAWMHDHNVVAHPRSSKSALVRKARLLWGELKSGVVRIAIGKRSDGLDPDGDQQPLEARDSQGVQEPARQGSAPTRTRLHS